MSTSAVVVKSKRLELPVVIPNAEIVYVDGVPARWAKISPELSAKWLDESNIDNRKLREWRVNQFARQMRNGQWRANGDAIRFDKRGRLIDGQHRLWACVLSGVSFTALVINELEETDYLTIDRNLPKSYADDLQHRHEKNTLLLSAAIRIVFYWRNGLLSKMSDPNIVPSPDELEIIYQNNPQLSESVNRIASLTHTRRLLTSSFAVLIHYAGVQGNQSAMVESFLERLGSGIGLLDNDPVYHLRRFLEGQRSNRPGARRSGRLYVLALAIKAWNAYKAEKPMRGLSLRAAEDFPQL